MARKFRFSEKGKIFLHNKLDIMLLAKYKHSWNNVERTTINQVQWEIVSKILIVGRHIIVQNLQVKFKSQPHNIN